MAFLLPLVYVTAVDNSGSVITDGARGYVFIAGTTNALQSYSDYELTSANSTPYITATSAGVFPPAYVEDGTLVRLQIRSADGGTTYRDWDDIIAPASAAVNEVFHIWSTASASFGIDDSMNGAVIGIDCSAGDVAVTASATGLGNGFQFTLQKTNSGGGSITMSPGGSDLVDGQSSYVIDTPFETATFSSHGGDGDWTIVAATSREEYGEIDIVEYTDSFTLALTDKGKLAKCNKATAMTMTVPPFASVPFAAGTRLEGFQYGAGEVTIAAGVGVTIRTPGGFLDSGVQYSGWVLTNLGVNEWWLAGDLEA